MLLFRPAFQSALISPITLLLSPVLWYVPILDADPVWLIIGLPLSAYMKSLPLIVPGCPGVALIEIPPCKLANCKFSIPFNNSTTKLLFCVQFV
jgi:hypothetical protein